jgi:TIR domain/WD domain, G-beta repeat
VEAADGFVFILSPESVVSQMCAQELAHALANHKRLVPIVCRDVSEALVPPPLRGLQWLFLRIGDDRLSAIEALVKTVHTDLDWVRAHTRLLTRAIEWDTRVRSQSFVLRGEDLGQAEAWLARAGAGRQPSPTQVQTEYILASRRAATRQQRMTLGAVSVGLVVALVLALMALVQRNDALVQTDLAVNESKTRATAEAAALTQAGIATSRQLAIMAQNSLADRLDLALLLGRQAYLIANTYEARGSLLTGVQFSPSLITFLRGHESGVTSVVFSRDGTTLFSGDRAGTVRHWDIVTRESLGPAINGGPSPVQGLAFGPNGNTLIVAYHDGRVQLWEANSRQPSGNPFSVGVGQLTNNVSFNADATLLAAQSVDGVVRLWDIATQQPLGQSVVTGSQTLDELALSPDGTTFAVSSGDFVRIWNVATGQQMRETLNGHVRQVVSLVFSYLHRRTVTEVHV